MAKEIHDDQITQYEGSNEVDVSALYTCSKNELIDAFISFANLEQKYLSKYKDLKKSVQDLTGKILILKKIKQSPSRQN